MFFFSTRVHPYVQPTVYRTLELKSSHQDIQQTTNFVRRNLRRRFCNSRLGIGYPDRTLLLVFDCTKIELTIATRSITRPRSIFQTSSGGGPFEGIAHITRESYCAAHGCFRASWIKLSVRKTCYCWTRARC